MHKVCIGHLKNKTPGACGWMEPEPRPDGNQPRIAPHGRVTPCVSQPLYAVAKEEMALQIAQGDDRMWLLRAPAPMFTRAGTQVEAESGRRPWEMWLDQRLSHGEGSQCGDSAPRMAALGLSPCLCHPSASVSGELSLVQLWESSLRIRTTEAADAGCHRCI